ncbi:hypothetical protein C9374_005094 [Naegleria lovaniensis]|uniref:Guanine nucleotide-binding protein subunit beta-like protein n=1 Tax=Naegleria lovaniensis TaxID=51637 RepID=A0AA88GKB1_NAELO|nr:uncharacterized protein C9374_005094 [Naegleria lovaniensis]KAG2382514.1 hypothetical protein C9374_005094 [Naegleria lovaniensis]
MISDSHFEQIYQSSNEAASSSNVISSLSWVPRGTFKLVPTILADTMTEPPQDIHDSDEMDPSSNEMNDDEDENIQQQPSTLGESSSQSTFGGFEKISLEELLFKATSGKNLTMYSSNDQDPYLKKGDSDSSEEADFELKPNDLPLVAIHNEEDGLTTLQVWIYEQEEDNLFIHHDLLLANYGLCTQWLNLKNINQPGNCIAIGTFEPQIEIWDLDVVDPIEPIMVLGEQEVDAKKKKKKNAANSAVTSHRGPILSMSFRSSDSKLASGSEDRSVIIWDLSTQKAFYHLKNVGSSPIQGVQFHNTEQHILLACPIADKCCKVYDARQQSPKPKQYQFSQNGGDAECCLWNPNNPFEFVVSQDNGFVTCFDIRKEGSSGPAWNIKAHPDSSCSCLSFSTIKSNLMASVGSDGCVRLWSTKSNVPELAFTKNVKKSMGEIFTCSFAPTTLNDDIILAYGGSGGNLGVFNVSAQAKKGGSSTTATSSNQ